MHKRTERHRRIVSIFRVSTSVPRLIATPFQASSTPRTQYPRAPHPPRVKRNSNTSTASPAPKPTSSSASSDPPLATPPRTPRPFRQSCNWSRITSKIKETVPSLAVNNISGPPARTSSCTPRMQISII